MTHFDDICDIAIGNYGLIIAAQAREQGITAVELNRWCKIGRLERRGGGLGEGPTRHAALLETRAPATQKKEQGPAANAAGPR